VSLTTKYGSTGLGMAITKSIVNHMNGQIDVKSKKGEGSTFTVTLTLAESGNGGPAKSGAAVRSGDGQTEKLADLKGRRVLLAEDMEINAEIVVMMLKRHGVEADVAQNGKLAVQAFTEHPEGTYDAILMDMRMPEMDGLEATKCIRSSGRADAGRIPIIALTANAFEEDVKRSLQAGLNAHLSKPVEPEALFHTLARLIHTAESGGKE
jgi:CheY-like chemotaxis protein